jgi:hypothetical protein
MAFDERAVIHVIEVIPREYEKSIYSPIANVRQHLAHGICGSLKPLRTIWSLFGGEDLNKAIREL